MSQAKLNVKILRTLLKNTKNISINYLFEYIPNHKIGGDSDGCRLKIFFPFSLLFQFEKKEGRKSPNVMSAQRQETTTQWRPMHREPCLSLISSFLLEYPPRVFTPNPVCI